MKMDTLLSQRHLTSYHNESPPCLIYRQLARFLLKCLLKFDLKSHQSNGQNLRTWHMCSAVLVLFLLVRFPKCPEELEYDTP